MTQQINNLLNRLFKQPSLIEPDPKYWPPSIDDPSLQEYVTRYRNEGIYPPALTKEEKEIIDRVGTYDSNGNKYSVTWTLGGHPIDTKIGKDDGGAYTRENKSDVYKRYVGCFGIKILND